MSPIIIVPFINDRKTHSWHVPRGHGHRCRGRKRKLKSLGAMEADRYATSEASTAPTRPGGRRRSRERRRHLLHLSVLNRLFDE